MKKITWNVGDLEVPGVGMTEVDKTVSVDSQVADNLIKDGIARPYKTEDKKKVKHMVVTDEAKGGKD